jgi:hypothetical protein
LTYAPVTPILGFMKKRPETGPTKGRKTAGGQVRAARGALPPSTDLPL